LPFQPHIVGLGRKCEGWVTTGTPGEYLECHLAYPEANVEVDARGVILSPSKPPVSPKAGTAGPRRLRLILTTRNST